MRPIGMTRSTGPDWLPLSNASGGRKRWPNCPERWLIMNVQHCAGMLLVYKTGIAYNVGMATRRSKKLTDQVRQAIDNSGLTRYRIAQDTGIDESALAKFYNRHRGLSLDNLDRLGEYLGLRIVMDRKPKTKDK